MDKISGENSQTNRGVDQKEFIYRICTYCKTKFVYKEFILGIGQREPITTNFCPQCGYHVSELNKIKEI